MVVPTTASLGSRAEEGGQGTSEKPPGERRLQDHVHFKKGGGAGSWVKGKRLLGSPHSVSGSAFKSMAEGVEWHQPLKWKVRDSTL